MLRLSGWVVVATLLAAAAYELALALGAGSLGPESGDGVAGSGVVGVIALLAIVAAVAVAASASAYPWPAALFAPSAAAFLVAFFFTYDDYYAPTLRRYSDGGAVAGWWVAIVAAVALGAGVLARLQPRIGRVMTVIVLFVVLLTTFFTGTGH